MKIQIKKIYEQIKMPPLQRNSHLIVSIALYSQNHSTVFQFRQKKKCNPVVREGIYHTQHNMFVSPEYFRIRH